MINKKHKKELKRRKKKKNAAKQYDKSIRGKLITDPTKIAMNRVLVDKLWKL